MFIIFSFFMLLDNFFPYLFSFIIGVAFCFGCLILFHILKEDKIYQFLLLPSAATLVLYSVFLCLRLEPVLFIYSPLITEILLVVVLAIIGFARRSILQSIRTSPHPNYERTMMRTTINEFFFVAQLVQNAFTLHLFAILLYSILPSEMKNLRFERFLYRELGVIIGLTIMYEALNETLAEYKTAKVFGDIGCYTLGALPPFRAIDSCIDMGASITMRSIFFVGATAICR